MKEEAEIKTAILVTAILGLATFLACAIAGPIVYTEINDIWSQLDMEMNEFKVISRDLWKEMMNLAPVGDVQRARRQSYGTEGSSSYGRSIPPVPASGSGIYDTGSSYENTPSISPNPPPFDKSPVVNPDSEVEDQLGPDPEIPPLIRSTSNCKCNPVNACPRGLPGPKGPPGFPGPEGQPGVDGYDGKDAVEIQRLQPKLEGRKECFHCPAGPLGLPGVEGPPGSPGMTGAKGDAGRPGRNSAPGPPGEMGPSGPQGRTGFNGKKGTPGRNGQKPVGIPGPKGETGSPGVTGPPGRDGADGYDGEPGALGIEGSIGSVGQKGPPGLRGTPGPIGPPGEDAKYCSCPKRGEAVFNNNDDVTEAPIPPLENSQQYGDPPPQYPEYENPPSSYAQQLPPVPALPNKYQDLDVGYENIPPKQPIPAPYDVPRLPDSYREQIPDDYNFELPPSQYPRYSRV